MEKRAIYQKIYDFAFLNEEEGLYLYENAPLAELMELAHWQRMQKNPPKIVSWQIDRNINITNVCVSQCKFCNFYTKVGMPNAYITSLDEYERKIEELFKLGGNQILLQGGLHPKLGLDFYVDLFSSLKQRFPNLRLHALGPPEIVFLAKKERKSYKEILQDLMNAGLDSLPGAGAEILCDRVRKMISPGKAKTQEWLDVMETAHQLNLLTSATMMFGHVETLRERLQHMMAIREVQEKKPHNSPGFKAFIAWPFQDADTELLKEQKVHNQVSAEEYIRTVAMSRLMLPNIENIQASWLTVGKDIAQICLYAGANDLGSIMIEEHVVSSAGAEYRMDAKGMQGAIKEAGFKPRLRDQHYNYIDFPAK